MPRESVIFSRDPPHLEWLEFKEYLGSKDTLTEQQAYIISGQYYDKNPSDIAKESNTTTETIRSQRSQLQLDKLDSKASKEVWKTPVPNVPFKHVGWVDYLLTDSWKREGNGGSVNIYCSVRPTDNYVAVVEETTITDESDIINPNDSIWKVTERRQRTTIYDAFSDFNKMSEHSPQKLHRDDPNVEFGGELFD